MLIVVRQDDISGFLGNVCGGIDRNADVRIAQRRGIVDAVAEEADRVTVGMQHPDDARLLQRRDFGEYRHALDEIAEHRVVKIFGIPAQDRFATSRNRRSRRSW